MPQTQATVDAARNAMFVAFTNRRNPAVSVAAAQAAAQAADAAWVAAKEAFRNLPASSTEQQVADAESLVTSTELARTTAYQQWAAAQAQTSNLPAIADAAATYYAGCVVALGNGT